MGKMGLFIPPKQTGNQQKKGNVRMVSHHKSIFPHFLCILEETVCVKTLNQNAFS